MQLDLGPLGVLWRGIGEMKAAGLREWETLPPPNTTKPNQPRNEGNKPPKFQTTNPPNHQTTKPPNRQTTNQNHQLEGRWHGLCPVPSDRSRLIPQTDRSIGDSSPPLAQRHYPFTNLPEVTNVGPSLWRAVPVTYFVGHWKGLPSAGMGKALCSQLPWASAFWFRIIDMGMGQN